MSDLTIQVLARYLEAKGTPRGWEHRKEKDDFAEQNIPPENLLFWRKVKNKLKGSPHERVEQFMEYLEEHPEENMQALQDHADKEVSKMTREWEKKHREQRKLEKDCDKNQTKYEDAWYKEQERATKEKNDLKQLKDKAEGVCRACPTCDESEGPNDYGDGGGNDDSIPFAASSRVLAKDGAVMSDLALRVAAKYKAASNSSLADVVEAFMLETAQHLEKRLGGSKSAVMKAQFPKWKLGVTVKQPGLYDHSIEVFLEGSVLHFTAQVFVPGSTALKVVKKSTVSVEASAAEFAEVVARAFESQDLDLY